MKEEPAERPGSSAIVPATSAPQPALTTAAGRLIPPLDGAAARTAPAACHPERDVHARWMRMQASSSRSVASA